jgi:hypothetical protein
VKLELRAIHRLAGLASRSARNFADGITEVDEAGTLARVRSGSPDAASAGKRRDELIPPGSASASSIRRGIRGSGRSREGQCASGGPVGAIVGGTLGTASGALTGTAQASRKAG